MLDQSKDINNHSVPNYIGLNKLPIANSNSGYVSVHVKNQTER